MIYFKQPIEMFSHYTALSDRTAFWHIISGELALKVQWVVGWVKKSLYRNMPGQNWMAQYEVYVLLKNKILGTCIQSQLYELKVLKWQQQQKNKLLINGSYGNEKAITQTCTVIKLLSAKQLLAAKLKYLPTLIL